MAGQIDDDSDRSRALRRRRLLALTGLAAALGVTIFVILRMLGGPDAESALDDFLSAYETGEYDAAAVLTDGEPEQVAKALEANVIGLDDAELAAEVISTDEDGNRAVAATKMSWQVPGIGDFAYRNDQLVLVRSDDRWLVRWSDDAVHPDLDSEGTRLGTERTFRERAPIVDRDGSELVIDRPVVEIGVVPAELGDAEAAVDAIATVTEADPSTLRRSIKAAESRQSFVPAITLRQEEFGRIEDELDPIEGIEFGQRELPLAPTKEFARALLGAVGPITAEQLDELGEPYAPGDNVGQFGLQARFERRLAGTPDRSVITRFADGAPAESLLEVEGEPGRPLEITLDGEVQLAAEQALGDSEDTSALVAIEPASGDVLAAASRPVDDALNRGFEGRYPPGSTFKVVATAALLDSGLDPDSIVDCPPTITVGGRSFRNFEGGAAGAVPFRRDFADSCNTAFVSLADSLAPPDLRATGKLFGLGREYELGVAAYSGDVPAASDEVEQAASMIGQGEILASPLAMAGVVGTVADGRWHAPRVLASDPSEFGPALPVADLAQLRSMMREVVSSGTGTALAGVAGAPIGKSGTAEYGSGDPPPTHAWFIAAREEVAVAVLVEDKPSGGEFAAPVAARFYEALD